MPSLQISLIYMIILLLTYNIISLKTDNAPPEYVKTSSFWFPILIFILPYLIFLAPAMVPTIYILHPPLPHHLYTMLHHPPPQVFLSKEVTVVKEDQQNLHACTIVVRDPDSDNLNNIIGYRTFRAVEVWTYIALCYCGDHL